jgi:linoleoyl-CoA desaturase
VHHLFPGVCHAHYIPLSEIIKQTAAECGLTYREVTMGQAIASHFRLLKRMGRPEQT